MIQEHVKDVREGNLNVEEYVQQVLDHCLELDKKHHVFTTICSELALEQARAVDQAIARGEDPGSLAGVVISVKDNLCVEGVESTACSDILRGYKPQFNAHVVERVVKQGAIIIGKTSMDEFGFGTFNQNTGVGYTNPSNPLDSSRVTGGSSGGSGGVTAALRDFAHVSLAESTGGSIECPAAYCGVVGVCPTYGLVSRYGLISYADSLDKIGVMACQAADARVVMDVISGFDERDSTSISSASTPRKELKKVGVLSSSFENVDSQVASHTKAFIQELKAKGYSVVDVELPLTQEFGVAAYYVLAVSEASTNLSRFSGLRYGQESSKKGLSFDEYASKIRSKHFSVEAKRRVMLGTFTRMAGYRDAYYKRCLQLRTKIIEEYNSVFEDVDILISPTMPSPAPSIQQASSLSAAEQYAMDALTVGPNLAGIPHVSVPVGEVDALPVGALLCAPHFCDDALLAFIEEVSSNEL